MLITEIEDITELRFQIFSKINLQYLKIPSAHLCSLFLIHKHYFALDKHAAGNYGNEDTNLIQNITRL